MTSSVIPYIVDGNALCDIMTASYFFLELLIKESVEIKGSNCNFFHQFWEKQKEKYLINQLFSVEILGFSTLPKSFATKGDPLSMLLLTFAFVLVTFFKWFPSAKSWLFWVMDDSVVGLKMNYV